MSQHDLNITNQTHTNFRQDLNSALEAVASKQSGSGDPAITYPFQEKIDTSASPAVVYIRKSSNDAWVRIGYIDATTGQLIMDDATDAVNSDTVDGKHISDIQNGSLVYAAASGTDTYTGTLSPEITQYTIGAHYFINFTNANTSTTPTLNLNSLGAKTIVKEGTSALAAGDIPAGHKGILLYDGTYMVLLNPKNQAQVASQAEMESATDLTKMVTPGRVKYSPSAAKAWINFNGTGTVAIRASYNVSSVTDNGVGDWTINFTNAMPNANYAVVGLSGSDQTNPGGDLYIHSLSTSSVRVLFIAPGVANRDIDPICISIFSN